MNMAEPNGTPAPPAPGPGARLARAAAKRVVIYGLLLMLSGVLVNIFGWADRLFFVPDRIVYEVPDKSLPYEAVSFPSRDQTKLAGWFFTAAGHAKGTVVHVHGNAANISNHFRAIVFLPPSEYNVLEFDYRGYGDSEGKPSRKGCLDDVHAAIDYVKGRKDVDPDKIVLFGQSMGGAYALVAAAERPEVKAVVAEAAFTSHRAIALRVVPPRARARRGVRADRLRGPDRPPPAPPGPRDGGSADPVRHERGTVRAREGTEAPPPHPGGRAPPHPRREGRCRVRVRDRRVLRRGPEGAGRRPGAGSQGAATGGAATAADASRDPPRLKGPPRRTRHGG
jgi:pimeloyl-ACP methyl ester carboxylesterase